MKGHEAIPTELIAPYVQRYRQEHDVELFELSESMGYARKTLGTRMADRTITFNMADKIMCRIGKPGAWRQDERLKEIYLNLDLSDQRGGRIEQSRDRVCAYERCGKGFRGIGNQKFCCAKCRNTFHNRNVTIKRGYVPVAA